MKKINKKVLGLTLQMSILACMVAQANITYAGSFMACDDLNSGSGYSSNGVYPTSFCDDNGAAGIFELNGSGFSSSSASIGVGLDANGRASGTISLYGKNVAVKAQMDMESHQIQNLADGVATTDAVNLGQLNTAKAEAITTSNAYTDAAKAEAISTSRAYTDGEISKLSDAVVHYDVNANGTINKNSITLAGGVEGTKISNVKAGNISSNSTDVINGAQLNTTNQALVDFLGAGASYNTATQNFSGPVFQVNGTNYYNVSDALEALDSKVDDVTSHVAHLQDQLEEGLAMSAAMTGLFQPYNVGKFNVSVAGGGYGGYGGQGAIAVGSGFRFNQNVAVKAGLASIPGKGKSSYNVGMNFEW